MSAILHTLQEPSQSADVSLHQAQRLAAMGMLVGGVAHDFNNILCAILGYGERALSDAARGSRLRRDLESILAAGRRGRSLVEHVLTSRRSGEVDRTAVDVETVVREALDLLRARRPDSIHIETALESGRASIYGCPTDVHRLFMNLATNAIQAMPAGGTLRVSLTTQRVRTAPVVAVGSVTRGDYVVLQVADSGTGICPKTLHRIFDRFFTTKDRHGGTGLGLSVVHDLVLEAGGAIGVESELGAGSRFTVYLALANVAVEDRQAVTQRQTEGMQ